MFQIPSTTSGKWGVQSQQSSLVSGLGGLLGSFVNDIANSLDAVANKTTNYAVQGLVIARLEPYVSFKEDSVSVRNAGDDIELRDAALTKLILDMLPVRAWRGQLSHLHVRNLLSGYMLVQDHRTKGSVHVAITARSVSVCIVLPVHYEALLKGMLRYPSLLAWVLEHYILGEVFDQWFLVVKPDGSLMLEMGHLTRKQTRELSKLADVPIHHAYVSHADLHIRTLNTTTTMDGCFVASLSTLKLDINPTSDHMEVFNAHLQARVPEGLAKHRERTRLVYGAIFAAAMAVLAWLVLTLRWIACWAL